MSQDSPPPEPSPTPLPYGSPYPSPAAGPTYPVQAFGPARTSGAAVAMLQPSIDYLKPDGALQGTTVTTTAYQISRTP